MTNHQESRMTPCRVGELRQMPVVLSQIFAPSDRVYKDAEWSLYHYPRQYFSRVTPYDRFIYYRPHGKRAARLDASHYFGHGVLGVPFDDVDDPNHRFVPLIRCERFQNLVPLKDAFGRYYETESDRPIQGQSAVRAIGEIPYQRILAAANVASVGISLLPSTEEVAASAYLGTPIPPPIDEVRRITEIPAGAGYVPHGDYKMDVNESAALQERARADHQEILRRIAQLTRQKGGKFWYNNHIDLVVELDNQKSLIEAKSINDLRDVVNRMRYGIGQLMDYSVRYRAELQGASPVLAFGRPPDRDTSFVATILQENGIAFISQDEDALIPLNAAARSTPLFR
jgi:hypothetical protein